MPPQALCGPACPSRPGTPRPRVELSLTLPGWPIGWDVFCFIGHRRFARHRSVPQIKDERADSYRIQLPEDAVSLYLRRYQAMLAARQQNPDLLRLAHLDVSVLWLSIGGLQPEKGPETLYAVRELNAGRVWFAQALLPRSAEEVRRLLARAREMAQALGRPVRLWISDRQDAFVRAIRSEFPGTPHRYCSNHVLRELARPTPQADSHAKVQMRKEIRGLRDTERQVLQGRPDVIAAPDGASQVVLDYGGCVRGILNDDRGGPLHPPGLRMAEALSEVRASLGRVLGLNKPGPAHGQLARLAGYVGRGFQEAQGQQEQVREQVKALAEVASTLEARTGSLAQRRQGYERLARQYQSQGGGLYGRLAKVMKARQAGLFVAVKGKGGTEAPGDDLELERWFRQPKGHERKRHGRRHAGVRIVQEGATLLLVLDAHQSHAEPFTAQELLPYRHAQEPADQAEAIQRRTVMRRARSPPNGPPSSPS